MRDVSAKSLWTLVSTPNLFSVQKGQNYMTKESEWTLRRNGLAFSFVLHPVAVNTCAPPRVGSKVAVAPVCFMR